VSKAEKAGQNQLAKATVPKSRLSCLTPGGSILLKNTKTTFGWFFIEL